jgi:hypothetical protein
MRPGLAAALAALALLVPAAPASADAVDDFQGSWTDRALDAQFDLAGDVPLRNVPWVGTHNSFNSLAEMGQTVSTYDPNQLLDLTDQLRLDVRSLELDVHWFAGPESGGAKGPVVCHARGANEGHAGCSNEKLLGPVLGEIAAWLRRPQNRDQVLLLYLEDHLENKEGFDAGAAVVEDRLGGLLYRPPGGGGCTELPYELTRNEILATGAQAIAVSDCGVGTAWPGTIFSWDQHEEERPRGITDFPECGPDFTRAQFDSSIIRYFEDRTALTEAVGVPDGGLTPPTVAAMTRCGVDLLGMDKLLADDGRLEAAVWSWARKQPAGRSRCAIQRGTAKPGAARWFTRPCAQRRRVACRKGQGWVIGGPRKAFKGGYACRRKGARYSAPRTGFEAQRLRMAMRRAGVGAVWLGYRRGPGGWSALDAR